MTDGIISSFSGIRNDDDWFQISVPIQGGNSGGPLVTENGNVVGVVVASVNVAKFYAKAGTLPQNVNYAIKSKLVLDFLKAQGVKNASSVPTKAALDVVDSATAMVIAKNGPIDVAYTVTPEQSAAHDRARLRQAAGEATEKKRLAAIFNRDKAVKTTFPDWEEVRKSDMFLAWMNEQTDNSSKLLESLNAADVMRVIRRYKAGQAKFAEKLLEREEAEHWRRVDGATDGATVQAYLDRFPAGRHAAEARVKLAALTKEQAEMKPGKVFKDCADCPEMVILPTGSFEMGSPASEAGFQYSESPQHRVSVRSFAAGKHEITRGQFAAFVRDSDHSAHECEGGSGKKLSGSSWQKTPYSQADSHPVVCVNWDDARAYVTWLSRKTGKSYRLLSEAEWEYAARAGTSTARYWGETPDQACDYANVGDQTTKSQIPGLSEEAHNCTDGHAYTAPVGSFKPNAFGLYDMIGNAFEWTEDCWNESYYGASSDGSAWIRGDCGRRVTRGGSFANGPRLGRSAFRGRANSSAQLILTGFRAARTLP